MERKAGYQAIWNWTKEQNWFSILSVVVVVAAIMAPIYYFRVLYPVNSDFGAHNQWALKLIHGLKIPDHIFAHPLYELTVGGLIWLTRSKLDAGHSSIVLLTFSQVASTLIIYFWLGKRNSTLNEVFRCLIAIGLTLAAPVILMQPFDGKYYFGYIGLVNFHNPTIIYLRPFALLLMVFSIESFRIKLIKWPVTLLMAVITVFATLVKPSYTLALLPALVCMIALDFVQKKPIIWKPLCFGIILPGVLVLAWQWMFTYFSGTESAGQIIFAPFVVETGSSGTIFIKFLLSVLFPIITGLVIGKAFLKDRSIQLALVAFLVGAGQLYLLAESGFRLADGNFRWGAQITLFVLFVACMRFIWRIPIWKKSYLVPLILGFLPHVISGMIYFLHCLSSKGYG